MIALTPWFSMNQAPVRSGVYLRKASHGHASWFAYFNAATGVWGALGLTPKSAYRLRHIRPRQGYLFAAHWCGILKES